MEEEEELPFLVEDTTRRIFGDSSFSIMYTQSKGRHVVTNKELVTAEIVLVSDPYIILVHDKYKTRVCHGCFEFQGSRELSFICELCNAAWYCSENCKNRHFDDIHSYECEYLKKLYEKDEEEISHYTRLRIRTMIRLLIKKYIEENSDMDDYLGVKFCDIETLISHDDEIEADDVLEYIKELLPSKYIPEDENKVIQLLSKTECNQFGLWSEEDDLMGISLHPSASFFNHSCIPNCYSEWEGEKLVFKTLYPVEKDSELTISYIDAHKSTKYRLEELLSSYHFYCTCPRCKKSGYRGTKEMYSKFYLVHLKCPVGPGLMRLEQNLNEIEEKDNIDLPIPEGYEVRTCMTCSFRRLSRPVPFLSVYIEREISKLEQQKNQNNNNNNNDNNNNDNYNNNNQ